MGKQDKSWFWGKSMAERGLSPEVIKAREDALLGYIKTQQGVSVLGLGIFSMVNKLDPDMLPEMEKCIQERGRILIGDGDELLYYVVKDLLMLKSSIDCLVTYSRSALNVLIRKYKCKTVIPVSAGPELPAAPLSSFEGIALYTNQLMRSFEDVMKEAGPIIATNRADGNYALDVQESFEDLRTSLVAVV